jgi:hypothetical protein
VIIRKVTRRLAVLSLLFSVSGCVVKTAAADSEADTQLGYYNVVNRMPYVSIYAYEDAPIIRVLMASDFVGLLERFSIPVVYELKDEADAPASEFAFPFRGVIYTLPARGFRRLYDILHAEFLLIKEASHYYEMRRKGFPMQRLKSYFID